MTFTLPDLPFEKNALEPYMSAQTLDYHHGKHHQAYIDKTNELIDGTKYADLPLEGIIRAAHEDGEQKLFNQSAQAWNHAFFWDGMSAKPKQLEPELAKEIEQTFNGMDGFRKQFKAAATGQFGSGWAWLVRNDGRLEIVATSNAMTPLVLGAAPLLTLDVWEHAYYLDYQNDRGAFVDAFLDHLINWEEVSRRDREDVRQAA